MSVEGISTGGCLDTAGCVAVLLGVGVSCTLRWRLVDVDSSGLDDGKMVMVAVVMVLELFQQLTAT